MWFTVLSRLPARFDAPTITCPRSPNTFPTWSNPRFRIPQALTRSLSVLLRGKDNEGLVAFWYIPLCDCVYPSTTTAEFMHVFVHMQTAAVVFRLKNY